FLGELLCRFNAWSETAANQEFLLEIRLRLDGDNRLVKLVDDRLRRAGWRHDAKETCRDVLCVAGLLERRNTLIERQPFVAIDSEPDDLPRLNVRNQIADAEDRDLSRAVEHGVDRVAATLE